MNEIKMSSTQNDVVRVSEEEKILSGSGVFGDGLGPSWKFWRRKRYAVLIVLFFGEIMKSVLRSNLSVAVFSMTENITLINENGTKTYTQDFDWDVKTRGLLLSVFFYGYLSTAIPGGILAVKFGGGKLFGFGILLTSVTTFLTPLAAPIHLYLFVALRIFEGMCEGILNPGLELLLASWIPAEERSSCTALVFTGNTWGNVISIAASSAIGFHLGWQAIFYFTGYTFKFERYRVVSTASIGAFVLSLPVSCFSAGGAGVVWFVVWLVIVKEDPTLDKTITLSEILYIKKTYGRCKVFRSRMSSIPYVKIITSMPVWAMLIATAACTWGHIMSITHFPAYIKDVLKLEYQNSGYLSSLPVAVGALSAYIMSPIVDILTTKNVLSTTTARKIYIGGGLMTMATFGFLIQQATSATSVIACLTTIQMFTTVCLVQIIANTLDIAPRYSSILGGLITTIVALCGILEPTAIGYITQNKTADEWRIVFSIQSAICLLGAFIYSTLGSGQLQPWADDRNTTIPQQDLHALNPAILQKKTYP